MNIPAEGLAVTDTQGPFPSHRYDRHFYRRRKMFPTDVIHELCTGVCDFTILTECFVRPRSKQVYRPDP